MASGDSGGTTADASRVFQPQTSPLQVEIQALCLRDVASSRGALVRKHSCIALRGFSWQQMASRCATFVQDSSEHICSSAAASII